MRIIKSPEEIRALVQEIADKCEACSECYFGGVYWHEPDDSGCNWSISMIQGPTWRECFRCVQEDAIGLRAKYNIPDPQ